MSSSGSPRVLPVSGYTPKPDEHVSLVVRQKPGGKISWVRAWKATIDFFGWNAVFDTEIEHKARQSPDGAIQFRKKMLRRHCAGKQMMIWRGRDCHRPGPNNRHNFRVANCFTLLDTAELAHFTRGDWHWMTSPEGVVRSREQWETIYQTGK